MTIWKYDMCPQCGGDLFIAQNSEGWYEKCVHCSYQHNLQTTAELTRALAQKEKETLLTDETSYSHNLTNRPYVTVKGESSITSANLLDATVPLRHASFSLN